MQAFSKRKIRGGEEYDKYFEVATGENKIILQNGDLKDTISLMKRAIRESVPQTRKIAQVLKGRNTCETCKNIWFFVYNHIQYTKDEKGREQVRNANRTWQDRKKGVDCDCYSVFICSILTNLGIENSFRIAKYNKDIGFQHVYPIVSYKDEYIVIDCVLDEFNKEHPFIEKKDYKITMENLGFIEEERKGYDYVPDSELGVLPILAVAKTDTIANAANSIISKVGGAVMSVANTAKSVLGIGKNKEGADEAERQLAAAKSSLQTLKTTIPQEIEQLRQRQQQQKRDYDNEIAQLRQTLNSL